MSRAQKTLWLIVDLLILMVFLTVVLIYFQVSNWPLNIEGIQLFLLDNYYFSLVIFWFSLFACVAFILIAFILIFYPKSTSYLEIKNETGTLTLTKKAVEGFIQSSLNTKDFIGSPKVNATLLKKKIKVKVTGDIKRTSGLVNKQKEWSQATEANLKRLLGVEQPIEIQIKLVNTADPKKSKTPSAEEARVV